MEFISNVVKKFNLVNDDLHIWFKNYEMCCNMFDWTDQQRKDRLLFFFDLSSNISNQNWNFDQVKKYLFNNEGGFTTKKNRIFMV